MVNAAPAVYRCGLTDSSRWREFQLRPDDIVISVPSKCGTTWMQMICALLIFQTPDLPAALTTVSPWLDMFLRPIADVTRTLDAQRHRRFIKTHTPLDGLPQLPGVTYVVVGRDPRDVAVSMAYHRPNLDDKVIHRLLASGDQAPTGPPTTPVRPASTRERVLRWIDDPRPATENLDSLRTVVHHLGQAWELRSEPEVILLHHADLCRDLAGEMRRLADRLGIRVPRNRWPALVEAATFTSMRAKAHQLAPDERLGLFISNSAFFRSGKPGQWSEVLNDADLAAYDSLIRSLADPDFVDWAEGGTHSS
ncbi:sulfotransferase domain-containing protein [Dactylosporangium siamense]|uniref:Glycolipid sulfotransferase n=1 Tax=Dactylosporangium siamense TaxID=685454 RepID=A0A919Q286_9ACTN|nr:sulfotransferase domain-containing protein [Dactylosporangium siamense]GIG52535.1 glycolipid sulfotransferase [Dactylosporangium siamense]